MTVSMTLCRSQWYSEILVSIKFQLTDATLSKGNNKKIGMSLVIKLKTYWTIYLIKLKVIAIEVYLPQTQCNSSNLTIINSYNNDENLYKRRVYNCFS
jgi:hypothetical protein